MDIATLKLLIEVMQQRSFAQVARMHNIAPFSIVQSGFYIRQENIFRSKQGYLSII